MFVKYKTTPRTQGEERGISSSNTEAVANCLDGALTSLQDAAKIGANLVARPPPTARTSAFSSGGAKTTEVARAAGEAMMRLAKLCEVLAVGDGVLQAGSAGGSRGREKLAAMAVEQYLRAMAVG